MDVESIHSTNSHRSHSKSINNNELHQFPNFDSLSYPRGPINAVAANNFPTYQYPNNGVQMMHPSFYTYNPSLINNNFIFNPNQQPNNAGYIPASVLQNNGYGDFYGAPLQTAAADYRDSEKIQVQIVPQDENWGADTCTAVTSDTGGSVENIGPLDSCGNHMTSVPPSWDCVTVLGNAVFIIVCFLCVGSPIVMIALPQLPLLNWKLTTCSPACEGTLINLSAKMIILIIGTIALHIRHKQYNVTRISISRAFVLFLTIVVIFSFWLFYSVRIFDKRFSDFHNIVLFAASLVDTLLFVHYLALILLEIRQFQQVFYIKVVRSPDGVSRFYRLGRMSIQTAVITVLQNYVTDFPDYNYDLVQCLKRKCNKRYQSKHSNNVNETPDKKTKYKVYNIDDKDNKEIENKANNENVGIKIGTGTSARLYEETEWEKKFRKRQMRLLVAVEEAFSHIQSTDETVATDDGTKYMASLEAAQTILPAIMKPLQKLLRVSRRHLSYSSGIVIDNIAQCLSYRLSPKYFVQHFSPNLAVMDSLLLSGAKSNEKLNKSFSKRIYLSWMVICDKILSKGLADGITFQLKPRDCKVEHLCLMCSVHKVPFFNLEEKPFLDSQCRFVLHSNSETSV